MNSSSRRHERACFSIRVLSEMRLSGRVHTNFPQRTSNGMSSLSRLLALEHLNCQGVNFRDHAALACQQSRASFRFVRIHKNITGQLRSDTVSFTCQRLRWCSPSDNFRPHSLREVPCDFYDHRDQDLGLTPHPKDLRADWGDAVYASHAGLLHPHNIEERKISIVLYKLLSAHIL